MAFVHSFVSGILCSCTPAVQHLTWKDLVELSAVLDHQQPTAHPAGSFLPLLRAAQASPDPHWTLLGNSQWDLQLLGTACSVTMGLWHLLGAQLQTPEHTASLAILGMVTCMEEMGYTGRHREKHGAYFPLAQTFNNWNLGSKFESINYSLCVNINVLANMDCLDWNPH